MTALYLFLAFGLGSLVGIKAERTVQANTLRQGEVCTLTEGKSITLGRTTWTAAKGTITLAPK